MAFRVFHRTWWRREGGKLVPHAGKKHRIGTADTEGEARDMCKVWNANHQPGALSDKAEYEEAR